MSRTALPPRFDVAPPAGWSPVAALVVLSAIGIAISDVLASNSSLSGGATILGLDADDDGVEPELSASLDLHIDLAHGAGTLQVYVEGCTTPRERGVSALVPESNADAGTALNRDGEGRLQISELKYAFSLPGERTLVAGLVDVTAYLDTTRINNDENMQFLGTSFLNNPAIEFPDYTLGVVYHHEPAHRGPALSVALTGSDGLADNPGASYEELFELSSDGKGAFLGAEAGWHSRAQRYRLGAWIDTADHPNLDGSPVTADNYGLYTTLDGTRGRHAGNVRVGAANGRIWPAAAFASLTYQLSWTRHVLGLGAARTWSSGDLPGAAAYSTHFEAYLRTSLGRNTFVTPSLQYVRDSAFGVSDSSTDDDLLVYAIRLRAQF
jgi:porin